MLCFYHICRMLFMFFIRISISLNGVYSSIRSPHLTSPHLFIIVGPAKAGIYLLDQYSACLGMDPRLCGDDTDKDTYLQDTPLDCLLSLTITAIRLIYNHSCRFVTPQVPCIFVLI